MPHPIVARRPFFRPLARRIAILIPCCAILIIASCTVGNPTPALLNANVPVVNNSVVIDTPGLFDATATPMRTALPRDPALLRLLDSVQTDQLLVTVNALAAMRTRHILSASFDLTHGIGIAAAQAYIVAHFHALAGSGELDIWTQPVTVSLNGIVSTSDNIIALLPGTDPTAGTIVIGAHYDTENASDPYSADLSAPGANNNASGIAALLAIAQAMLMSPPRATVIFVALTGGESGLQGSAAFINTYLNTAQPPIVPRAMLNLDTIGGSANAQNPEHLRLFSDDPTSSPSRQLARWLALIASAYPELPTPIVQSQPERIGRVGDQQIFSAAAIPAVHVTEGIDSAATERTADDTIDTIAPGYLTDSTRSALMMADSLADGPPPPANLVWQIGHSTVTWTLDTHAAGYVLALRGSASLADQIVVLPITSHFTSDLLQKYGSVVLSAFDTQGLIGQAAPEISLR